MLQSGVPVWQDVDESNYWVNWIDHHLLINTLVCILTDTSELLQS